MAEDSEIEVRPVFDDDFAAIAALAEVDEIDDEGNYVVLGFLPEDDVELVSTDPETGKVLGTYPKCPPPTKWRLVGQSKTKGKFVMVGSLSAKATAGDYTVTITRSVNWSASVTSGYKVSIPMVEAQVGITLTTTAGVQVGESVRVRVPKGRAVGIFAGVGYIVRTFQRTVYGSAMCNPVVQRTTIASPYGRLIEIRWI